MYNIGRGKSGGVVLQCKACSHVERVNEFDDRLAHTRSEHGREPVGRPMSMTLESRV